MSLVLFRTRRPRVYPASSYRKDLGETRSSTDTGLGWDKTRMESGRLFPVPHSSKGRPKSFHGLRPGPPTSVLPSPFRLAPLVWGRVPSKG